MIEEAPEAEHRLSWYWEAQAKKYRRLLQSALASDRLEDSDRDRILAGVNGRARDAKLMTPDEAALLADLRALAPADRAAIRRMIASAKRASAAVLDE